MKQSVFFPQARWAGRPTPCIYGVWPLTLNADPVKIQIPEFLEYPIASHTIT